MQNRARDIVYAHTPCPEDGNSTLKHRLSTKNCKGCKQIVSAVESCLGELWCDTNRDSECFGIVPASLGSSCVLCSQLRDLALKLSWDALYLKVCIMRTAEDCVESHLRIGPDLSDDSGLVFFFEKMLDILPKETHESCITAPGHHSALIYRPSLYLADFQFMNAWLKSCHSAHGTCRNYQATYRPKFLIHCGRREVCQDSKAPYACLSYVWGVPSSTDTSYEPVLALPTLPPRTVADAMTVALHLGLEYLWVDRYCIEQDNHAEKINAIGNMDAIYRGADITIIASTGLDPHHGLTGISAERGPRDSLIIGNYQFFQHHDPLHEIENSKWNTRGWTFQEALLSRRCLVFTPTQVYFQCLQDFHAEGLSETAELISTTRALPSTSVVRDVDTFSVYLAKYYTRQLSFPEDILRALEGVTRALRKEYGNMVHFFGIPCQIPVGKADCQKDTVQTATYAFAMALAWTIGYKIPLEELPLRSRDSNFPTWIWASCRAHYNSLLSSKLYLEEYQPPRPYATTHYNIAIILTHLDGTQFNILEYIQGNDDHTQFRPWIDITTYIQLGHFFKEGSRWEWSADSEVEVTLHINPQQLRDDIIAIFVGILSYTSESIFVKYLFAQKIEDGTYNLVGNGSRLEWDPERPPNRDLRTAAFLDRHFSDGWRTDTVRLV